MQEEPRNAQADDPLDRRARIIERIAATERPDRTDLNVAAADLGVTVTRVRQLAAAFRRHGRRGLVPMGRREPGEIAAAIAAARATLDMTDVPSGMRKETARRIGVIGRWLSDPARDAATRRRYAGEYGLTPNAFLRAVEDWVLEPVPRSLRTKAPDARGADGRRTVAGVDAIIERAVAATGPSASTADVVRLVARWCGEAGLPEPAWLTVDLARLRVLSARTAAEDPAVAVCIDQVLARFGPRYVPPTPLVLAFTTPAGRILAHRLTNGAPEPRDLAAVTAELLEEQSADAPVLPLELAMPSDSSWLRFRDTLEDGGVRAWSTPSRGRSSGFFVMRDLGNAVGGMTLYRMRNTAASIGSAVPPTLHFDTLVRASIIQHNQGRADEPFRITTTDPQPLLRRLRDRGA